ncbi:MAG TPA: hypothetical protein EYG79_00170 [Rhodobacteraceae bacterium]|nr:hypothetical protein [Paracoccaceae bacterium]
MSLIELSNGQGLSFPRRLFESFVEFSYTENAAFAAEIEKVYMVNWQIIYVNELPGSMHLKLIEMLGRFITAIEHDNTLTDVRAANRLLCAFRDDLLRYGQA